MRKKSSPAVKLAKVAEEVAILRSLVKVKVSLTVV